MSIAAVEGSCEGATCRQQTGNVVAHEGGCPQGGGSSNSSSSSSSHNGSRDNTASATYTPVLDRSKLRSLVVCGHDVVQNASSCDDVVMTRRRSLKMTSSSAQLNDARDESKCQMLHGTEKEVMNSPKQSKSRRDQFSKVFPDIAETEEVIKSYHCAFFRDILLQGFLYITPNWFCFYSKLLGKKCVKIPVSVVTNITKRKTAIIIPNAIRVNTETDKYVFGSLMSRDNTYQLMFNVWQAKRTVLQANIPLEPEKSDVNEDFDAVDASVKTNSASSLIESVKDEFAVSSDASFCSDLESTSQSAEHLQPEHPPSASRASEDTAAVDLEGPKEAVARFSSAESTSFGINTDQSNHGIRSKTLCNTVNDLVMWVLNLPRTCLFLTISTVLVIFLLLSAMLLAYKLIHLQMQLAADVGWSYHDDFTVRSEPYREVLQNAYVTGHHFHISNVEKIHLILESHVEVLNKVNQVLKELQRLSVNGCSTVSQGVDGS